MKKKVLLSSIVTIALCLCLIAGSTFALFTSESVLDVEVTSGKVEISADITNLQLWSVVGDANGDVVDENGNTYFYQNQTELGKDSFLNTGKADFATNVLSLERVTPGDKVSFSLQGINTSDVNILVRYTVKYIGEGTETSDTLLANGMVLKADGVEYSAVSSYSSKWEPVAVGGNMTAATIELGLPVDAGNEYQHGSAKYAITVEAIQGNAVVDSLTEPTVEYLNSVATAEELAAALTSNEKNIYVNLSEDINVPITSLGSQTPGSGEYKLGGADTEKIVINLNGHKLTIDTTYWSAIGANNDDATIIIKNGSMNSAQATGTWNSYDIRFANCNYVIENVEFDKAIALENVGKSATLKNVTINESHDYYALWITAEGQTVNIDGLTVNSAGRGIKIDEQYVGAGVAKVTLNVSNATFTSVNKGAIMVKSVAGADITLNNVDISGVNADTVNPVWVDEDSASYFDLVSVVGGTKYQEN